MRELMHSVLDILFPPSTEARIVRSFNEENINSLFEIQHKNNTAILSSFSDIRIQALIHEAKFHGNKKAQAILGKLLMQYFQCYPPKNGAVLTVIPLSKKREHDRGYNQVTEILKNVQSHPVDTSLLIRTRDTTPQTKLSRKERIHNVEDAFTVNSPESVSGTHIVLIDDVTTTGATMDAGRAALRATHATSVTCIALAG